MNSFFFQIILGCLAVAIVVLYVKPTFADIGKIQDAITQYKEEQNKVNEVNMKLAQFSSKVGSISAEDQTKLLTYMPDKVDSIAVSRDIYNMSLMAGVNIATIDYKDSESDTSNDVKVVPAGAEVDTKLEPVKHTFNISLSGSYEKIKNFLGILEQNNYPLEVHDLEIVPGSEDDLTAKMEIITYSHI